MDTALSLALLCCLLSASSAFPAGLGYGRFKSASRPLSIPASGRFNPLAVATPPIRQTRPSSILVPAPTTVVQTSAPIGRPVGNVAVTQPISSPVGNVVVGGGLDHPGDGVVVVGGGGGGGVLSGGLVGAGGYVHPDWDGGDSSISDSQVTILSGGSPAVVPAAGVGGGGVVLGSGFLGSASALFPGSVLTAGSATGEGTGVHLVSSGPGLPSAGGVQTVVGGDLSFGEGSRIQVLPSGSNSVGLQTVVGGSLSVGEGSRVVLSGGPQVVALPATSLTNTVGGVGVGVNPHLSTRPVVLLGRDTPDLKVVRRIVRPLRNPTSVSSQRIIFSSGDTRDSS